MKCIYSFRPYSGCRSPWRIVASVVEANLKNHISPTTTGKYLNELMAVGGAGCISRLTTV